MEATHDTSTCALEPGAQSAMIADLYSYPGRVKDDRGGQSLAEPGDLRNGVTISVGAGRIEAGDCLDTRLPARNEEAV